MVWACFSARERRKLILQNRFRSTHRGGLWLPLPVYPGKLPPESSISATQRTVSLLGAHQKLVHGSCCLRFGVASAFSRLKPHREHMEYIIARGQFDLEDDLREAITRAW